MISFAFFTRRNLFLRLTTPCSGGKIKDDMEPIYIVAIAVGGVVLLLFLICVYVIAKKHREQIERRIELEAVYSDPKLAKMEYDIAFYDDDLPRAVPHTEDKQVTIDDVMSDEDMTVQSAIFTKADDGMEEISGSYEPDDK